MEDSLKTRIDELIKALNLSQAEFAKKVGVSANAITNWKTRGIKGSSYEKISIAFPSVNMTWLRDGVGEMFTSEISGNVPDGVPYYDVDFEGGFDMMANDQTVIPSGWISIEKFVNATCLCNITGHSMEPEISHGDIIVLRKIEDWSFLPLGEIYAIVTRNDMRTVKRIGIGSRKDTYKLIPSNKSPEYSPQEIHKKDILQLYKVLGCLKRF